MDRAAKFKLHRGLNKVIKVLSLLIIIALAVLWIITQNNFSVVKTYTYENSRIPKTFVGYTIVQVSDLGNQDRFVENAIDRAEPHIVVFTGNLADSQGKCENSLRIMNNVAKVYPVIYVIGEQDIQYADYIREELSNNPNITELSDSRIEIKAPDVNYDDFVNEYIGSRYIKEAESGDEEVLEYLEYTSSKLQEDADKCIVISGMTPKNSDTDFTDVIYDIIDLDRSKFQIMMYNQSQFFNQVNKVDLDLVLSGNTFGKDRFNNNIKSGIYSSNGTSMIVSNGIGEIPEGGLRIFNMPSVNKIVLSDGTIRYTNLLEELLDMVVPSSGSKFENDGGFSEHRYTYN